MTKTILTIFLASALAAAPGCMSGENKDSPPVAEVPTTQEVVRVETSPEEVPKEHAADENSELSLDELELSIDMEDEAEDEITADNLSEALAALEAEVAADVD